MKIVVIVNRTGWSNDFVRKTLKQHNDINTDNIISGGADGVDTFAQRYAKEIGAKMVIYYPDPTISSPRRYYNRNYTIVSNGDKIIAFNKNNNPRTGTSNAINQARKLMKKVIIIEKDEYG